MLHLRLHPCLACIPWIFACALAQPVSADDALLLRRGPVAGRGTGAGVVPEQTPERRLKLIQLAAPPSESDIETIVGLGARIVQYVPHNGYLVWAEDTSTAAALANLAATARGLRLLTDYDPTYAVSPELDRSVVDAALVEVTVQLYNVGEHTADDVDVIEQHAQRILSPPELTVHDRYLNLRVSLPNGDLDVLAGLPTVVNIEPYLEPELLGERQGQILAGNVNATGAMPSGAGYLAWLGGLGFSTDPGDYPVVAIVDDGVDDGTTSPVTSELYELNNAAAASRVAFAVTPPGSGSSNPHGPDGHGHLNASIIAGYNNDIGPAVHDFFSFHYGLGIIPYGRVGNVRVFTPTFDVGTGHGTMAADYYSRGTRISSNSWGSSSVGTYDVVAQSYDALSRDARQSIAGNQELLFVFAAGNDGPSATTMGSPATAKNVLTVGASESFDLDPEDGTGCGDTTTDGDDARDIAGFSSRGPCTDGRIKPDIVAPGTFIHGSAAQPTFNGAGVCGAASNDFTAPGTDALYPPGSAYTWSSGTSVAAPAISGYAALVAEYLARVHGITAPSPALLKAFILHSARHLTGAFANDDLPSPAQGFGIADMGRGFSAAGSRFIQDQSVILASSEDSTTIIGSVPDPTQPVRVVLAWTDAPGPTFASAFVNDLNLSVDLDGTVYNGNNFTSGVSQPGGTPDFRNNAEAVFLPAGSSGPASITIEAASIGGDGVPGNGDLTDQDYALVAYNFTDVTSAGVLGLDRDDYNCADSVVVTLRDLDLLGLGLATITLTSTSGDVEVVALAEAPPASGVFSGTIATDAGAVTPASGTIETTDGDVITATYADLDDGTGQPAVVDDTADVDCVPPAASNATVTVLGGTFASISVDTDEETALVISYGTSCTALVSSLAGITAATSHEVTITGLASLSQYFFAIEIVDRGGNVTVDDNGGNCFSFTTLDPPDYFTQRFGPTAFDLGGGTLTLTPDGSGNFYSACRSPAVDFPVEPSGGTFIELNDDGSHRVDLTGGALVAFYGTSYGSFYVNSNGNITFGVPDSDFAPTIPDHFNTPRIAALFDDLDPSTGGAVSWKQLVDRVAVTYQVVPQFELFDSNSFQVEMFFDGTIRITHLGVTSADALVGISAGLGVPIDFIESDLSGYDACSPSAGRVWLDAPIYTCVDTVTATVEDTDLSGAGSADVVITTDGGDSEAVGLGEVPSSSGIFVGSLPTSSGGVVIDDGILQLGSGQTVTATYEDADAGSGVSATRQSTARSLCTDHFTLYRQRVSREGPKFYKFGPVALSDELGGADYKVLRPLTLGVPANKNGEGINDPSTHLEEYKIKAVRGTPRFEKVSEIRVVSQCGDLYLQALRPTSLLIPSRLDDTSPVPAPSISEHEVDHFLCYRAKAMRKLDDGTRVDGLAKGTQVDVADAFQTRRYDLKRVTRLCTPVDKSGTPLFLNGPDKGTEKAISPAPVRNPNDRLVCYRASLARKVIPQEGCGPLEGADSTKIDPKQEKHTKRIAIHVNNQFGPGRRNTVRELEICIPSLRTP